MKEITCPFCKKPITGLVMLKSFFWVYDLCFKRAEDGQVVFAPTIFRESIDDRTSFHCPKCNMILETDEIICMFRDCIDEKEIKKLTKY